jgi:CDP-diglyceride synthetase
MTPRRRPSRTVEAFVLGVLAGLVAGWFLCFTLV